MRTPFVPRVDLAPTPCGTPSSNPLCPSTLNGDSKHILNAQVSIRAPCCKQWFDCAECHAETQSHRLAKSTEMTFICKKCKKAFRKDAAEFDESDEYCPHCDNHFVSVEFVIFAVATEHYTPGSGCGDSQGCIKSGRRGSKARREVWSRPQLAASGSLTLSLGCSKMNAQSSTQPARSTIKIHQTGWSNSKSPTRFTTTEFLSRLSPQFPTPVYPCRPAPTFPMHYHHSQSPVSSSQKANTRFDILIHTRFTIDSHTY